LTIKVDGIKWDEASSLYGLGPKSQSYTVRLNNDAIVRIIFGDGKQGARLPTGQENVVATYRSGIGSEGEVLAGSLKLLKTKPQGIRGVTNLVAASGAAGPETIDKARINAPLTVLTMDRIVSLDDYEDFTRAFTGIGKAQAVILWNGESELVHITIADNSGNTVDTTSSTYQNLVDAIEAYRNPIAKVQVDTFEKRLFHVEATVKVDDKYTASTVMDEVRAALESTFSFNERGFGQSITAAEVISTIQRVAGVVYIDLNRFYLADDVSSPGQTSPPPILTAHKARWPLGGNFEKSQLLLINPVGIMITEISQ
jgi:predicted phage baseplate assembly protein